MSCGGLHVLGGRGRIAPMERYRAPWWLPGGHAQTIWPALFAKRRRGMPLRFDRERWTTPDGDFIDVDFLPGMPAGAPLLVLFHGLEGSSSSHYAQAFGHWAREARWRYAVPHFRGCSGQLNLAPRAYHSGDHEEIGWILGRLHERGARTAAAATPPDRLYAVGVSLGGNALLRWAVEAGAAAGAIVHAVAAISAPIDLAAGGFAIGRGLNRLLYARWFLRTMKPKALAKLAQHPGLFDRERMLAARDLYEFDNVYTAPLHGFRDTDDYWARCSALPHLHRLRVPTLLLNARNDPFLPGRHLPSPGHVAACVTLWQPAHGGHVGFARGGFPGHVLDLPDAVMGWMKSRG
jgi:predicted alpha/beta-fold hydrolase